MSDEVKAFLDKHADELAQTVFLQAVKIGLECGTQLPTGVKVTEVDLEYLVKATQKKLVERFCAVGLPIPEELKL